MSEMLEIMKQNKFSVDTVIAIRDVIEGGLHLPASVVAAAYTVSAQAGAVTMKVSAAQCLCNNLNTVNNSSKSW